MDVLVQSRRYVRSSITKLHNDLPNISSLEENERNLLSRKVSDLKKFS